MGSAESNSEHRLVVSRNTSRTASEMDAVANLETVVETEVDTYSQQGRIEAALRLVGIVSRMIELVPQPEVEDIVKKSLAADRVACSGLERLLSEVRMNNNRVKN